ncbi:hypothetical protein [Desulfovibrio sp. TomC]|uniref:hypothetical protein n=1 Tax=Desulfovibrio sp. TomC TaxID=1562888 RepID=UPI000574661E|nr:hypothetical protein [Desulfovibrio sp. TomC]KHK02069.1 hypothetical protein NY78_2553 [Desulfovibrio sp. TomC]
MTAYGYSLELESGALTAMAGLPVVAACLHGGRVMVSDGASLGRIGGDTDDGAPIAARLALPPVAAGLPARLLGVAVEGVVAGRLAIEARSDAGSELDGEVGPGSANGFPGRTVARLPRGLGRTWEVRLAGEDGAVLDIAAIELTLLPLDRRV